ncbi:hypothetical protein GXW82_09875 [Streptacidiphilus sp. 4-A2]|nr:hypothetical protein [Streptacidiphilus sp. 4-A2]
MERETFKDIERIVDVNFWGGERDKAFLPHLIESATAMSSTSPACSA